MLKLGHEFVVLQYVSGIGLDDAEFNFAQESEAIDHVVEGHVAQRDDLPTPYVAMEKTGGFVCPRADQV